MRFVRYGARYLGSTSLGFDKNGMLKITRKHNVKWHCVRSLLMRIPSSSITSGGRQYFLALSRLLRAVITKVDGKKAATKQNLITVQPVIYKTQKSNQKEEKRIRANNSSCNYPALFTEEGCVCEDMGSTQYQRNGESGYSVRLFPRAWEDQIKCTALGSSTVNDVYCGSTARVLHHRRTK